MVNVTHALLHLLTFTIACCFVQSKNMDTYEFEGSLWQPSILSGNYQLPVPLNIQLHMWAAG